MKYCPNCGIKTLPDTGDYDYDAGDIFECLSCGYRMSMSEMDMTEVTVRSRPRILPFDPLYSPTEMMLRYGILEPGLFFGEKTYQLSPKDGEKITFRRTEPFGSKK